MNSQVKRILKAVSFVLTFSLVQVYVQADLLPSSGKAPLTAVGQGGGDVTGRLTTRGNNPVTVNGNSARSGETILSGAQIQTPPGVGATVQLGPLGRVDVAPETVLNIAYTADGITVNVTSGCLILTSGQGKTGTVTTSQGGTERTSAPGAPLDICVSRVAGAAPVVGQGAAANAGAGAGGGAAAASGGGAAAAGGGGGGLFGLGTTGTILLASAAAAGVAAAIIVPCRRGPNPSPGTPRGRNDECR